MTDGRTHDLETTYQPVAKWDLGTPQGQELHLEAAAVARLTAAVRVCLVTGVKKNVLMETRVRVPETFPA